MCLVFFQLQVLCSLFDYLTLSRHLGISLEMLLKLVRVFGSVIYSTLSASSSVGVDIEAEQRYALLYHDIYIFLYSSYIIFNRLYLFLYLDFKH